MTFKRVMLVVLPLLGAVFVFFLLRWLYHDWEASLSPREPLPSAAVPPMPKGEEKMKVQAIQHEVTKNLNLLRKDKQGRPDMRILADVVYHKSDKTADFERPRIQFFTKAGEIINLMADQGRMITKGDITSNPDNIESGVLWGHVTLSNDRGTPDDHSDDLVGELQDLKFNNEMYDLSTDGPVVLVGLDVQLTARKMRMALDRQTRRINTMTFLEDIRIVMETDKQGLPGQRQPAEEPAAPPGSPAGGPRPAAGRTGPSPGTPAAKAPAGQAATGPVPDDRSEMWRIDLAGNVEARQGAQRLGCERLSLYNRSGRSTTGGAGAADAGGAASAPGAAPPDVDIAPPPPPQHPGEVTTRDRASRQEGHAFATAKFLQPGAPPPLVVVADGPLIITPVSPAERKTLGDRVNLVTASGAPVEADDGQMRIVGAELQYNTQSGSASIIGKDNPILLEQPGRLYLTGRRLDFDQRQGIVDVQGEGQLKAQAATASFSGAGRPKRPAAEPAPGTAPAAPETSILDASWTRSMRLEFYRLPTGNTEKNGLGEIKHAEFHGQSVVKQRDGLLKGDDLAIDFLKPEAGRGQAIERLVGRGDVFLKNEAPPVTEPPKEGAKPAATPAIGDLTCQKCDIRFERDAAGDTQPKSLDASGAVAINDPDGKIRAEELKVAFGLSPKGAVEPQFFEAFGKVLIERTDLYAEGDHVRRDLTRGTLLLEGRPAVAKRGNSRVVGAHIEFAQADGKATVRGAGELEMPATTDFRGRPRAQAEPLLVKWQNSMLFEDQRNFAQFDGNVVAATGTSRLGCERLWIYFADRPETPAAAPAASAPGTASAAAATGAATAAKAAADGGDMRQLFGRKALVRVLAEKDVRAIEQQLEPDKSLRYQMEILGDNLTYLEENRKAYTRGPGRLRILSRDRARPGEMPTRGLDPNLGEALWKDAAPEGYARTEVAWTDSMAYDGSTDRAYFKGNVETIHIGRGTPGPASDGARRRMVDTRIRSGDLQVVFSEKKAAAGGPGTVPFAPAATTGTGSVSVQPEQEPVPAAPAATPREERMAVEKLVADGDVLLWVDDRRGSAERLIYQRDPELIRLYRGTEDWARLWQANEASQEFGEIVARVITYEPATGRVEVVDQQAITVSPKPKPGTGAAPKPGSKALLKP